MLGREDAAAQRSRPYAESGAPVTVAAIGAGLALLLGSEDENAGALPVPRSFFIRVG
jgi:hypothetical protein